MNFAPAPPPEPEPKDCPEQTDRRCRDHCTAGCWLRWSKENEK